MDKPDLSAIYEAIADTLACARTKGLMGEQEEASRLFLAAWATFQHHKRALRERPGYHALCYAVEVTRKALNAVPTKN